MVAQSSSISRVRQWVSSTLADLGKEQSVLRTLHQSVKAAMARVSREDPSVDEILHRAHGYAVFPSIGKAAAVIGGAFGKGEVFEKEKLIGYAGLVQLTIGVQLGGQAFTEIICFRSKSALERFKHGRLAFSANAAAVIVKAGAAASLRYDRGVAVLVYSEGGLLLEAGIGGQKFFFAPAALGRLKRAPSVSRSQRHGSYRTARRQDTPRRRRSARGRTRTAKR